MRIKQSQKVILGAGVALAVAMLVYPPWTRTIEKGSGHGTTEYRLIISDTEKVRDPEMHIWATTDYWTLDLTRLFLQLFGLSLITGVIYLIASGRTEAQDTSPGEDAESRESATP